MTRDLTALLCPKSVAVIGASRSSQKIGAIVLRNILNSKFPGKVYPVNPNAESIEGLKCYKDVSILPEVPDLAVIAVPALGVQNILGQCANFGVKNAVVFASGFKEIGESGEKLEEDLAKIAKKFNINLLGPNCLGFVNNNCPINATFGEQIRERGNLRFISQSGALAASLFDWCNSAGLGVSDFITLGNKAVLNENDFLSYFSSRPKFSLDIGLSSVNPIGMYLESISNGKDFVEITNNMSKTTPIFILKPGKTKAAVQAMHSHTGAIAEEGDVLNAALEQAGVIRCQTMEEFFDLAKAFAWEDAPNGPRVGIVSNAGGPGVISADAVASCGLELAEFDDQTKAKLSKILPRSSSILNPVDVLGDALADRYIKASEIVLKHVDALLIILTPQIMTQVERTANLIGELSKNYNKPIFCSFIGGKMVLEGERKLNELKIPSFRFPEQAIYTISKMWQFKKRSISSENEEKSQTLLALDQSLGDIRGIVRKAVDEGWGMLDNISADKVISSAGIPTPPSQIVESFAEAKSFADKNGWPVVLKLSSPDLLHKKEVGGVILDISSESMLEDAIHKMVGKIEGLGGEIKRSAKIQIQKGVQSGVEVIVGVKRDPTFGSVLLFGAGGSYAELLSDKNLHLLPVNSRQAETLIKNSKVYKLLGGTSGKVSHAVDRLADLVVRMGKLAEAVPEAIEIEINPVIVTLNNVWAVDSKVVMEKRFLTARVLDSTLLASKFHQYKLRPDSSFMFKPGQYISVKVAEGAVRAYSIAARKGSDEFDLLVDTRPGGPGSIFFECLKKGDKITYLGPFGVFTFKEDDRASDLLFLATGSGISAIKCMIDYALLEKNCQKKVKLYFGLTYEEEIFWKDHFEELEKEHPNFEFEIAVREPGSNWKGACGFITALVAKDYPDAKNCAAYLCGNKAMIVDATDLLIKNGCPKERIYTERFA